jgi:hypothetical protein
LASSFIERRLRLTEQESFEVFYYTKKYFMLLLFRAVVQIPQAIACASLHPTLPAILLIELAEKCGSAFLPYSFLVYAAISLLTWHIIADVVVC